MKIYNNDNKGNWEEVGSLSWDDGSFEVETENDAVDRIVKRVNNTKTWDTAEPEEYKNAPVAETSEELDENRGLSLVESYLSQNGFGLANEDELNNDDAS